MALYPDGRNFPEDIPSSPDTCPVCLHAGQMQRFGDAVVRFKECRHQQPLVQVPYHCPKKDCGALFIMEYQPEDSRMGRSWRTVAMYPHFPKPTAFPASVQKISSSFVDIYGQAQRAGAAGLTQLHGMGLRKALEFLIKDYCISKTANAAEKERIKSELLGVVINNRVTDTNVKACAERAAWLGNDETHYSKKWDADIADLQRLISLTINWIDSEIATAEYLAKMPKPKKSGD